MLQCGHCKAMPGVELEIWQRQLTWTHPSRALIVTAAPTDWTIHDSDHESVRTSQQSLLLTDTAGLCVKRAQTMFASARKL